MTADELIGLLPRSLRESEDEVRALRGLLGPVADVSRYLDLRTRKILELLDPATVPDDLVPLLAAIVGVGLDFPPSNIATTTELRRLIPIAVTLWRQKGTRPSWRSCAAVVAGSRVVILDWFYLRTVSGSPAAAAVIPAPGGVGGYYSSPETVSDLWVSDPAGAVPVDLLVGMLDAVRPANERINLYLASFVDDFSAGLANWSITGTWRYDPEAWTLQLRGSGAGQAVVALDGLEDWTDYHLTARLAVSGIVDVFIRRVDNLSSYKVRITQASGSITLYRVVGGVSTVIATYAGVPLVADFPYMWAFEVYEGAADTTVQVYREGALLISYTDANPARPPSGSVAVLTFPGALATLSLVLLWEPGLAPIRIGPT